MDLVAQQRSQGLLHDAGIHSADRHHRDRIVHFHAFAIDLLDKLKRDVPVYLYGAKPKHLARIQEQVAELGDERLIALTQGETYSF